MCKNWCVIFCLSLFTSCNTGDTEEGPTLNEAVSFVVTTHLYPGTEVKSIAFSGQHNWFYASGNEIVEVNDNQKTVYPVTSGILSMDWNIQDGCLWFGTESSGLGKLYNGQITYYTQENHGLPRKDYIRNITCDQEGRVWFNASAHKTGGPGYYKNGIFHFFTPENSLLPDNLVKSIAHRGNHTYIATGGYVGQQKIVRITGTEWELLPVTGYYLKEMATDLKGVLYVIDDHSLSSMYPNNTSILVFDGIKTENLVPPVTPAASFFPQILTTDLRNYLWAVKFSSGGGKSLSVYNGINWTESNDFPDDFIHCITVDSKNTIWLGTDNGIYQLAQ